MYRVERYRVKECLDLNTHWVSAKRVMLVVPLLNSSIPILVLRCLDLDF
jgi:hypothetical protein